MNAFRKLMIQMLGVQLDQCCKEAESYHNNFISCMALADFELCSWIISTYLYSFFFFSASCPHGPGGKNSRATLRCWKPLLSAAGTSPWLPAGSSLPRTRLRTPGTPEISYGHAGPHSWKHERNAVRTTGQLNKFMLWCFVILMHYIAWRCFPAKQNSQLYGSCGTQGSTPKDFFTGPTTEK